MTSIAAWVLALPILARAQAPATKLVPIAVNLQQPVAVVAAPGDDERLYIVEQAGRVRVWKHGVVLPAPLLDLSAQILQQHAEAGMLGIVFDPNFASNRSFFVDYVDLNRRIVVERWRTLAGDPEHVEPGSNAVIVGPLGGTVTGNHFGGCLQFGPDGMLYVAVGDRFDGANSQLTTNDFGKLLRVASDGSIPAGNPIAGSAIWALGLRNPWRFSFDRSSGDIYVGDVGGATLEEIDRLPAGSSGQNFGWPATEGDFDPGAFPNYTRPIHWYANAHQGDTAVVGGYVYRGCAIPSRVGRYFYCDYGEKKLFSIALPTGATNPVATEEDLGLPVGQIGRFVSFGEDNQGELYLCEFFTRVLKLVPGDFVDCNGNFVDDRCDLALGRSRDLDGDGTPDECEPCPVALAYCTAGTSSSGCAAAISFAGSPSATFATPFAIDVASAEGARNGLVFYGINGATSTPWHGGSSYLCVRPPLQRTPLQTSGGTMGQCDGHIALDWNAYQTAHPFALGQPWQAGAAMWVQAAIRDPNSPAATSLSDAFAISVCL